jgi:hypothetical protein
VKPVKLGAVERLVRLLYSAPAAEDALSDALSFITKVYNTIYNTKSAF